MVNDKLDQRIGAAKEKVGQGLGDEELELKGKAQQLKGEAEEKLNELKDNAAAKANDLLDKVRDNHQ